MSAEGFHRWIAEATADRDESHGIEHFERVRQTALLIAEEELTEQWRASCRWPRPVLLLELAALAHDFLDHKYVDGTALPARQAELLSALRSVASLSDEEARAVLLVAQNVSFSKETRGLLDLAGLQAAGCERLRDIVSDADKVDALGDIGVRRLFLYHRHAFAEAEPAEVERLVRDFCREQLLLRADYMRTPLGRKLAAEGCEAVRRFMEQPGSAPAGERE